MVCEKTNTPSRLGSSQKVLARRKKPGLQDVMALLVADPNARLLPLTQGKYAIVDANDYERLQHTAWRFNGRYAGRKHNKKTQLLHRFLIGEESGKAYDHVNGNKLDNRRFNLREATPNQNMQNVGNRVNNKTGFKGVYQIKSGKFRATIRTPSGERLSLGNFPNPEQAFTAYSKAAITHHGKFVRLA